MAGTSGGYGNPPYVLGCEQQLLGLLVDFPVGRLL
jgi:hypothetical protein